MKAHLKGLAIFVAYLVVVNVVVAPVVRKIMPKDAAGVPLLQLL